MQAIAKYVAIEMRKKMALYLDVSRRRGEEGRALDGSARSTSEQ